jgi:2',3'-cyclic-nucleotide 2'-phosphodiesterase/3'-nucleotidase
MHEETIRLATGTSGGDGEKGTPLGTTTARFQPENEIRDLPEGRLRDTAVMDLILKIQLLRSGADVTSVPLFNDDGDLPEGEIYYQDIFNIYKHDNTLYTMDVTGAELKKYMEWSAEYFNTWKPGDINISFDPDVPGYDYDMFAGVDYEVNLSMPQGRRIENVTFKGEPLRDDQVLKLAVNNYRYSSCIKTEGIAEGNRDWESSGSIRDMIVEYFAENSPVAPETDNNWRITGVDLSTEDPRRAEIIGYINAGLLQTPYDRSYNLADYDALAAEAEANRKEGKTFGAREDYH